MRTPTPIDSEPEFELDLSDINFEADADYVHNHIRSKVFSYGRQLVRKGWMKGVWLHFGSGSVSNPIPHGWPLNEGGVAFRPEDFDDAYSIYDIPDAYCICYTQESDPDKKQTHTLRIHVASREGEHMGLVVVSCRKQTEGCGLFIPLHQLYSRRHIHPIFTTAYPKQAIPGPGIIGFDPAGLVHKKTPRKAITPGPSTPTVMTPKRKRAISGGSASKYQKASPPSDNESPTHAKGKGKGKALMTKKAVKGSSFKVPLALSDDDDDIYVSPTPPPRSHQHDDPPRYSTLPPVNSSLDSQLAASSSTNNASHSGLFKGYEVNEHFFGDMWALTEPVHPSLLVYRNVHVPPLLPNHIAHYLDQFKNGSGVPHDLFICMVDKCNCGLFFCKDYLNQVHGPNCPEWLCTLPPPESRPFNATALDALATPIQNHPIPAPITALSAMPQATSSTTVPSAALHAAAPVPAPAAVTLPASANHPLHRNTGYIQFVPIPHCQPYMTGSDSASGGMVMSDAGASASTVSTPINAASTTYTTLASSPSAPASGTTLMFPAASSAAASTLICPSTPISMPTTPIAALKASLNASPTFSDASVSPSSSVLDEEV